MIVSAAMNMMINACTILTKSTEMPARACITPAPAYSAPHNRPAAMMLRGLLRANSDTAIASKPTPAKKSGFMLYCTPAT
jgi:hypothetical protein